MSRQCRGLNVLDFNLLRTPLVRAIVFSRLIDFLHRGTKETQHLHKSSYVLNGFADFVQIKSI